MTMLDHDTVICRWESCRSRGSLRLRREQLPRVSATATNWPWRPQPTNAISSKDSWRYESLGFLSLDNTSTFVRNRTKSSI